MHLSFVCEWILLGLVMESDRSGLSPQFGLNLVRVDDSGKVGAGHHWSVEGPAGLFLGWCSGGSEDGVEALESAFGEDEESTEMSAWGELEDVQSVDVASLDAWKVSGGLLDGILLIVIDDQRPFPHDVPAISVFAGSSLYLLGSADLGEVVADSEVEEGAEHGFGVWQGEVVDDEWELWHVLDVVASRHHERGAC